MNTLAVRMAIARAQSVTIDEAALAKVLLFERCGGDTAYATLVAEINDDAEGKPRSLKPLEEQAMAGQAPEPLPKAWKAEFATSWLALNPPLSEMDLRPVVYVSREHLPILTAADRLSSDAAAIFEALVQATQPTAMLNEQIVALGKHQVGLLMDRFLVRAKQVQEWGNNVKELAPCLTVARVDPEQAHRLAALLEAVPVTQLKPGLIPVIAHEPWAPAVFARWQADSNISTPVRRAITTENNKNRGAA
jgi:predicted KAP-like P-loop ATPase